MISPFSDPISTKLTLLDYLESLIHNTWTLTKSPAGALQFEAFNSTVDYPDPFNGTFRHATMLVSDLALREDPIFGAITKAWVNDFDALTNAFAAAWCKSITPSPSSCDPFILTDSGKSQSSSSTAIWVPSPATSAQKCQSSASSGRIPSPL